MTALATVDRAEALRQQVALMRQLEKLRARQKILTYYPETGPLRRELYPQHMQFFELGAQVPTRCFMAANRVGKTEGAGGYEMVCHLTGQYPAWWPGRRFTTPVDAWCAGDTKETVRDILQLKLVGPEGAFGTGLIPGESLINAVKRQNGNGALDYVLVKHKPTGQVSRLGFKSYDQGREAFQGTEKHVVWLDEESNESVRSECVMRLMTTNGLLIETFTPLRGLTPIVLQYLGDDAGVPKERMAVSQDRAIVFAGWDDVPHLSADQKRRLLAESEPHLRLARSKGIPSLGSGAIYPVEETEIIVDDFVLPAHWPRAYGLDVGWNRTAAIFGAIDRDADVVYLYSEHYQGQQEPSTHVAAIKARGELKGVIDPASRGRSQKDGEQLLIDYQQLGLDILTANNSRESGLYNVHQRLATGRLKVFRSLRNWLREYRIYRRDEKGHVVKENDHLMDACVTGDTLVWTDEGRKPIELLVGCRGRVLSRAGALCEFIGARKTIENTPVVRVEFENGSAVRCTPDHPFLTSAGWVEARHLQGLEVYNAVSQSIQVDAWKSSLSRPPFRSLRAFATGAAASISSATARACIALSGLARMGATCLMGTTFTMTTRTAATTSRGTLCSWPKPSTRPTITRGMSEASRPQQPMQRVTGTHPMPAASGTDGTTPESPTSCTSASACDALSAAARSMAWSTASRGSAATAARPSTARRLVLTMSNALAWSVAAASWRIATRRSPHARADALLRCAAVQNSGNADVYCLTVPGPGAFAIGPGLVVHNTRYFVVSGLDVATVPITQANAAAFRNKRRRKVA